MSAPSKAEIPAARRLAVFDQVRQAVAAVPGIAAAAIADITPVTGGAMAGDVEVLGVPLVRGRGQTFVNRVSPGWLSIRHAGSGRPRFHRCRPSREPSASPSSTARSHASFSAGRARSATSFVKFGGPPGHPPMEWKIVGMVADAVYQSLRSPVPATMYWAFGQIDRDLLGHRRGSDELLR